MTTQEIFARVLEISEDPDIPTLLENIVQAADDDEWPVEEKIALLESSEDEKAAFLKDYFYLES
jgi:hypothetical protein